MRKLEETLYDCELPHIRECRQAAAEFYVDLESTVATQPLIEGGSEAAALASLYSVFQSARAVCKKWILDFEPLYFAAADVMKNMRPFLSKWHKLVEIETLKNQDPRPCLEFRTDLKELQQEIMKCLLEVKNICNRRSFVKPQSLDDK